MQMGDVLLHPWPLFTRYHSIFSSGDNQNVSRYYQIWPGDKGNAAMI